VPLFAIVRPIRRRLVIATLGRLQGVGNLSIIGECDSSKGHFFHELLPSQNELSPAHGGLLLLRSNAALHPSFIRTGNAGEARQVPLYPPRKATGVLPLSSASTAKPYAANLKLMCDLPVAPPDDRAGKLNTDGAGKLNFEVSIPPRSFAAVRFAN